MAIIELNNDNQLALGIWNIQESLDQLFEQVREHRISTDPSKHFGSDLRKAQWASARLLLSTLLNKKNIEVVYDEFGKPYIKDHSSHISISHSQKMVAVIVDHKQPTGIDIEFLSDKVRRIESKFLNEHESAFVDRDYENEHLMMLWSAKEALYKAYGRKKLIFKEQILVEPFDYNGAGKISASIKTDNYHQAFQLKYEKKGNYILVYLLNN